MTIRFAVVCLLLVLTLCSSDRARAGGGPALRETLTAGPYVVDVTLGQDPPVTDQPVRVSVVPHDTGSRLSGYIIVFPGLGTDAVPIHSLLSSTGETGVLAGMIHMPVRGAWDVQVQLDGPKGQGEAMFPITVAAPGAMPVWLAWIFGLSPLLIIAWLIRHQSRYRRVLLAERRAAAVLQS